MFPSTETIRSFKLAKTQEAVFIAIDEIVFVRTLCPTSLPKATKVQYTDKPAA